MIDHRIYLYYDGLYSESDGYYYSPCILHYHYNHDLYDFQHNLHSTFAFTCRLFSHFQCVTCQHQKQISNIISINTIIELLSIFMNDSVCNIYTISS